MHVCAIFTMLVTLNPDHISWNYLKETLINVKCCSKLLYLLIASLNFILENRSHITCWYERISSRSCRLIGQSWAELYNWYSACYKLYRLLDGSLLNLMVSIAGNLYFLTQFIRFYDLLLDDVISWILLLKKTLLAFSTVFL